MKRVFICSRYSGDTGKHVMDAEKLCRVAVMNGDTPFAPHLFYTRFLDEESPEERDMGIGCGLRFMDVCDEVWMYSRNGISDAMKREITYANARGKKIVLVDFDEQGKPVFVGLDRSTNERSAS